MPIVLGIDTSCDDTGVGIAENDKVLANVVRSQNDLHAAFGGVVPERAGREHLDAIDAAVDQALHDADLTLADIDAVAATRGPGLVGALLVGLSYGKALAWGLQVPFVPVHHLAGHLAAATTAPPFLALIASGGHSALFEVREHGSYLELGRSRDDAAGEAFDKVARLLGLGFPGGPALAELAEQGDDHGVKLPWPMKGSHGLEFSFSGLKTAVALLLERHPKVDRADVAATFERVAVGSLVEVTLRALQRTGLKKLVVAGGVAANRRLRASFDDAGVEVVFPPPALTTDNGAMIALAGAVALSADTAEAAALAAGTAGTGMAGSGLAALESDASPYLPLATDPADDQAGSTESGAVGSSV